MNKEKMGKFLKKLREDKKYSQEKLCDVLSENFGPALSSKAISGWENGKSIPDMETLKCLSKIYKISIDEILDGEYRNNIDFMKEYFIVKKDWGIEYDSEVDLFEIKQKQIIKIINRFNELEIIRSNRWFTHNEELEFKFLFENFYFLSDYYKVYADTKIDSDYLILKYAINNCVAKLHSSSKNDIVWEFKKMIIPNIGIGLSFNDFTNWTKNKNDYIINRFKKADFWEKDLILNQFQKHNFIQFDYLKQGAKHLKAFEKSIGKEYNQELEQKEILKLLIKNGACINPHYLNSIEWKKEEKRVIDRLEYLYNLCLKPISFSIGHISEGVKYYKAENNLNNRFATKYYVNLAILNDIPYDDLFKLFIEHEEFPSELINYLAEKNNINMNQEEKYAMSDFNSTFGYIINVWNDFHKIEKEIQEGLKEIPQLELMLENKQHYYTSYKKEEAVGSEQQDFEDYCYFMNRSTTYDELKKGRRITQTKKLLSEIDSLSIDEIRSKYFETEEYYND